MTIPEYRRPPKNQAAAIAQSRNWFLFAMDEREFVGDDYEPMGHLLTVKIPPSVAEILKPAWDEHSKPPLFAGA